MHMLKNSLKALEYRFKIARSWFISDRRYRLNKFQAKFKRSLNIISPCSLNDKINYRMIYDKNPLYTRLADKWAVREYVSKKIGAAYLVPVFGIYQQPEEINLANLPDKFVLKCNHDCGSAIVCEDKTTFDWPQARAKMKFSLAKNMYYASRETHYRDISPLIICETFIETLSRSATLLAPELYRIHCFSSRAKIIEADFTDANGKEYVNVYDENWQLLPLTMGYSNTPGAIARPTQIRAMLNIAERLAENIDYCRIDLFLDVNNDLWFSEMTFAPCNGLMKIAPVSWDFILGEMWQMNPPVKNRRC